ncbi:hypothetical protein ES703_106990 [subsurface metagenome]
MDKKVLLILAVTKAVIAVMLAGVVVYSVVAGVDISNAVLQLIVAVLGAYFGFSTWVYIRWRRLM